MAARNESPKYVYGIIKADAGSRFSVEGVGDPGSPVSSIKLRDIRAVVSDVEPSPVRGSRRNLMAHSRVLEDVSARCTVLPMRFGVVLPDEEAVKKEILEPRYELWCRLLDRFEGLVELTLKAVYRAEPILREILEEDRSVAEMRERARTSVGERAYFDNVELGEMVAQRVEARGERDAAAMIERLRGLSVEVKVNPVSVDRMLLNAAFLVQREDIEAFDAAVNEIGGQVGERIHFKYLGPLPPYSFVQMDQDRAA